MLDSIASIASFIVSLNGLGILLCSIGLGRGMQRTKIGIDLKQNYSDLLNDALKKSDEAKKDVESIIKEDNSAKETFSEKQRIVESTRSEFQNWISEIEEGNDSWLNSLFVDWAGLFYIFFIILTCMMTLFCFFDDGFFSLVMVITLSYLSLNTFFVYHGYKDLKKIYNQGSKIENELKKSLEDLDEATKLLNARIKPGKPAQG